jgi:hypothetical protein
MQEMETFGDLRMGIPGVALMYVDVPNRGTLGILQKCHVRMHRHMTYERVAEVLGLGHEALDPQGRVTFLALVTIEDEHFEISMEPMVTLMNETLIVMSIDCDDLKQKALQLGHLMSEDELPA